MKNPKFTSEFYAASLATEVAKLCEIMVKQPRDDVYASAIFKEIQDIQASLDLLSASIGRQAEITKNTSNSEYIQ